ncbi:GAF domain-containing protein [Candidatus Bathyarchaeota archaeon]|mgnify:CR=1 FL=1|nr:GAF domain-containing protein [Candidatus Bathyarchaeota archaeon]
MARSRKSGLDFVGDITWGTHMCQFYQTKQDLLDVLVPYFVDGLKHNEFCVWVTSDFLNTEEAIAALKKALPDFDSYLDRGQIEVFPCTEWYLKEGKFELQRVLNGWVEKHDKAIALGFAGMRVTGNPFWISNKKDWADFTAYEAEINNVINNYKMLVLCTYSLDKCNHDEIIDVITNHQFCMIKRSGKWTVLENSAHKKIEETLRKTESRFLNLFSSMAEGVAFHKVVYDNQGSAVDYIILDVNPAFEQITGISREDAVGKKASELYGTKTPPYLDVYAKVVASGVPLSFEAYFAPMEKHFSISCSSSSQGTFATVFHDITERKKSVQDLAYSNQRLALFSSTASSLLSNAEPEIIIQDICMKVMDFLDCDVFFNFMEDKENGKLHLNAYHGVAPEIAATFEWLDFGVAACGCAAQQAQRILCENIQNTTDPRAALVRSFGVQAYAANPIFSQEKVVGALSFGTKKKPTFTQDELSVMKTVTSLVSVAMRRKESEETLKARTQQLELTQRKLEENAVLLEEYATQLEELAKQRLEQLKDSERLAAIGATAGMVGHDIRNPLQSIIGDLYLVKAEISGMQNSREKESIAECVNSIEESVDYINKIVQDLQDYARPLQPSYKEVDLEDLLKEVTFKNSLPATIEVSVLVDDKSKTIVTDASMLKRVLINLVNNAVQAMPEGGKLSLTASEDNGDCVLVVADTGVGIPEDRRSKLFVPLMTTKSKGQGFGLPVVKRMTESLSGNVSFESQIGQGTKFIVRLPNRAK